MNKSISSPTIPQSLGALLKSSIDIVREDKGLNGDLDRLRASAGAERGHAKASFEQELLGNP